MVIVSIKPVVFGRVAIRHRTADSYRLRYSRHGGDSGDDLGSQVDVQSDYDAYAAARAAAGRATVHAIHLQRRAVRIEVNVATTVSVMQQCGHDRVQVTLTGLHSRRRWSRRKRAVSTRFMLPNAGTFVARSRRFGMDAEHCGCALLAGQDQSYSCCVTL